MNYNVEIGGHSTLPEIELQIQFEEARNRAEFRKSEIARYRGRITNIGTFEKIDDGLPNLIRLSLTNPSSSFWSGRMLVEGSEKSVWASRDP